MCEYSHHSPIKMTLICEWMDWNEGAQPASGRKGGGHGRPARKPISSRSPARLPAARPARLACSLSAAGRPPPTHSCSAHHQRASKLALGVSYKSSRSCDELRLSWVMSIQSPPCCLHYSGKWRLCGFPHQVTAAFPHTDMAMPIPSSCSSIVAPADVSERQTDRRERAAAEASGSEREGGVQWWCERAFRTLATTGTSELSIGLST
ncbi:hypothetical protein HDK64DRAFT_114470 [Phyllosticta capitalensis]